MKVLSMKVLLMRVLLIMVTALLAAVAYFRWVTNPALMAVLKTDPASEEAERVLVLTLPSGRQLPVNYLKEGDRVFLGADFGWWRELVEAERVAVCIRAQQFSGSPQVLQDDPAYRDQVFSRLRPNAQWLPEWLEAKLVIIALEVGGEARDCR